MSKTKKTTIATTKIIKLCAKDEIELSSKMHEK